MFVFKKIKWNTLFFFALASLVPIIIISVFVLNQIYRELERNIINENNKMAAQVRSSVIGQFENYKKQLTCLAALKEIKSFEPNLQNPIISDFFRLNPFFYNVYIYDSEGVLRNICYPGAGGEKEELIGRKNIKDSQGTVVETFKQALKKKKTMVSQYFKNNFGEIMFCVAAPVFEFGNEDRVTGVLSAAAKVSDSAFHRFFDPVIVYDDEYLLLINESSEVLTMKGSLLPQDLGKFDFPVYKNGVPIDITTAAVANGTTFIGGRRDIVFTSPLAESKSTLVIGRPYNLAFNGIRVIIRYIVWISAACLLLAALLSVWLSNRLSRPIELLVNGLNKIEDGVLSHRIPAASEDEIGVAITAFNNLAGKLQRNKIIESVWSEKWKR